MSATESIILLHERMNRLEGMSWFEEKVTKKDFDSLMSQVVELTNRINAMEETIPSLREEVESNVKYLTNEFTKTETELQDQMNDIQAENNKFRQELSLVDLKQNSDISSLEGHQLEHGPSAPLPEVLYPSSYDQLPPYNPESNTAFNYAYIPFTPEQVSLSSTPIVRNMVLPAQWRYAPPK